MAKPSSTFPWATDVGATSDPGPANKATGYVSGTRLPAKWLNYTLNGAHKWFEYLSNLHNETDFLDQAFTWYGAHSMIDPLTMNGGTNEVVYSAARTRTMMLPLDLSFPGGETSALDADNANWFSGNGAIYSAAGGVYNTRRWPFRLPDGTSLTGVKVGYHSTTPNGVDIYLRRIRANKVSPFTPTVTDLAFTTVSAATQEIAPASIALPAAVDGALDTFAVDILFSAAGQAVRYIEITFTETVATGNR